MTEQELISIIVPVYNVEGYLPKCLDTISRQTYQNMEIILVDDGSTDNSGNICDEFAKQDPRAVVIHQPNMKLWAARNTGQRHAKGNFIMFVDGDDYIHRDAVKTLYEAICLNEDYDLAIIGFKVTSKLDEDTDTPPTNNGNKLDIELSRSDLLDRIQIFSAVWGKLYRKRLIGDIFHRNYLRAQDYDFNIRAYIKANKVIWVKMNLYFYVQREGSLTHLSQANIVGRKFQIQILRDNLKSLSADNNNLRHYLLRELYIYMTMLISLTYNTAEESSVIRECRDYEHEVRRDYWTDKHIGIVEKMAMTLNIRYPHFVRVVKNATKGRLSWHMLSKF